MQQKGIKILSEEERAAARERQKAETEALMLKTLELPVGIHPRDVVRIYNAGSLADAIFMALEYARKRADGQLA